MEKFKGSKSGWLFVIAAASGAGKSTLAEMAMGFCKGKWPLFRLVTCTTRASRPGEVNGRDYEFLSAEEFLARKQAGFFFETIEFNHASYGSPRGFVREMASGHSFLVVTDLRGMLFYKKNVPGSLAIWVTLPSLEELRKRLLKRGTENPVVIEERLAIASKEMAAAAELEVSAPFFDLVLVNDDLGKASMVLNQFIEEKLTAVNSPA